MSELKPCQCGQDINRTLRIQELWKGYQGKIVGIAYCENCTEVASFVSEARDTDEFTADAYKAWNARAPSIDNIVPVIRKWWQSDYAEALSVEKLIAEIRALEGKS